MLLAAGALGLAGCAGGRPAGAAPVGVVRVVAAENFWGSIASQLGGAHVQVVSIITNPDSDPHDYEPTAADARAVAGADVVISNGVGYDPWVGKLLAADGRRLHDLNVGTVVGVGPGGNPHRWYDPADVRVVEAAIATDLSSVDPADAPYFAARRAAFDSRGLRGYNALITHIRDRYTGVRVGASESIFSLLAPALGLDVVTPSRFLRAISEGGEVSAADITRIDAQIDAHVIAIYVYNSQNATPDVAAQLARCRAAGIPTATITETLQPATASFQQWQVTQLQGIAAALATATGR